jgi:Asp-tRNA(Asn)/Glu-tRNA(Gln) amidotransferase A subunit family amidase
MADTALWALPATELAARIRRREASPVEVTEAVLARMERLDGRLGAFCTPTPELARAMARAAEAAVMRGEPLGPLHGVPVSIKDMTWTKGIRTTRGSRLFADFVPEEDPPVVERLRAAGAVILGKTNTPEFGWKGATENLLFPPTRNPWRLERTAGGSSGGAAAAVAAGLGPLATGTDGAGSIRIPAAFCGIVGHKPSFGRVPVYPAPLDVAVTGPMARTVRDAALLLDVLAGPDERDRFSLPDDGIDYLAACAGGVAGWRVAWSPDLGYAPVEPEVRALAETAARRFADLGAVVEEAHPGFTDPREIIELLFYGQVGAQIADLPPERRALLDPALLAVVDGLRDRSAFDYARMAMRRNELWQVARRFFERYDLLLTPAVATTAFPLGLEGPAEVAGQPVKRLGWTPFTFPFNLTGQPACTVPCGRTAAGLPVGLQIVGRRNDDTAVLRAAAAYEAAAPWAHDWPPLDQG